jgi:hypothetical protein
MLQLLKDLSFVFTINSISISHARLIMSLLNLCHEVRLIRCSSLYYLAMLLFNYCFRLVQLVLGILSQIQKLLFVVSFSLLQICL